MGGIRTYGGSTYVNVAGRGVSRVAGYSSKTGKPIYASTGRGDKEYRQAILRELTRQTNIARAATGIGGPLPLPPEPALGVTLSQPRETLKGVTVKTSTNWLMPTQNKAAPQVQSPTVVRVTTSGPNPYFPTEATRKLPTFLQDRYLPGTYLDPKQIREIYAKRNRAIDDLNRAFMETEWRRQQSRPSTKYENELKKQWELVRYGELNGRRIATPQQRYLTALAIPSTYLAGAGARIVQGSLQQGYAIAQGAATNPVYRWPDKAVVSIGRGVANTVVTGTTALIPTRVKAYGLGEMGRASRAAIKAEPEMFGLSVYGTAKLGQSVYTVVRHPMGTLVAIKNTPANLAALARRDWEWLQRQGSRLSRLKNINPYDRNVLLRTMNDQPKTLSANDLFRGRGQGPGGVEGVIRYDKAVINGKTVIVPRRLSVSNVGPSAPNLYAVAREQAGLAPLPPKAGSTFGVAAKTSASRARGVNGRFVRGTNGRVYAVTDAGQLLLMEGQRFAPYVGRAFVASASALARSSTVLRTTALAANLGTMRYNTGVRGSTAYSSAQTPGLGARLAPRAMTRAGTLPRTGQLPSRTVAAVLDTFQKKSSGQLEKIIQQVAQLPGQVLVTIQTAAQDVIVPAALALSLLGAALMAKRGVAGFGGGGGGFGNGGGGYYVQQGGRASPTLFQSVTGIRRGNYRSFGTGAELVR